MKLDDYIKKNRLDMRDVYEQVLIHHRRVLDEHISGDVVLDIDAYGIDFLNELYGIDSNDRKGTHFEEDQIDIKKLEEDIVNTTKSQIIVDEAENIGIDDLLSDDNFDFSYKIGTKSQKIKEDKKGYYSDKDIESLLKIIHDQNQLIDKQNNYIDCLKSEISQLRLQKGW